MIKIQTFNTSDALVAQTESLLRETLGNPGNLMLSGGSTPYTIYNRLAANPCPVHANRMLFLSDERMVPFDSEKNNAHNLEPMLRALDCADRFIRIDTALPRAEAAQKFAVDLEPLKSIDLGFLGMGADGHTAGFFTKEQARRKSGTLTLHTDRPDGMEGVSVTPAFLSRVKNIFLLVTGESKRSIMETFLQTPESIAAGIALSDHANVELWTDLAI